MREPDGVSHPWLLARRAHSLAVLQRLAACTTARHTDFLTVAAAGSLGRLEAGPGSDFDSLFIVAAGGKIDPVAESIDAIFHCARECGLAVPKVGGIFRTAVSPEALTDPAALGRLDETPALFGQRIQILLDARPVFAEEAFRRVRSRVLDWYCTPATLLPGEPPWAYLQGDLVRYAHSYRNWQAFRREATQEDSWALRQAKLRLVRYVTWMGLYLLVLHARDLGDEGSAWLKDRLELTPLERIVCVVGTDAPDAARRVVEAYAEGLMLLQDPDVRRELVASSLPMGADDMPAPLVRISGLAAEIRRALEAFFALRARRQDDVLLPF